MADPIVDLNNLEDDTPAPAPVADPPPAPVAEAAPPAPVEAHEEEPQPGDDARVTGLRTALIAERKQRQALVVKAQRADELERWAAEKAPYITVLEQNPDLFKRPQAPTTPVVEEPADDPDALEAAKLMDFYTSEGKPDTAKGAQWLKLQDRRAGRVAQQAVQPWQDATMQERANQNFYRVLQVTTPTGAKASEQAVRAIWQKVMQEPGGMRTLANPESAAFLSMAALGVDAMMRKAPAAPTQDPVITEASGGSVRPAAKPISQLEEKVLKNRGVSAAQWQEHTKGFVQGRPTSMEED